MEHKNLEEDRLILVNEQDEEIGVCGKWETHLKHRLHRAFSLFIYNEKDDTLLIHRRAEGKYHSGGLWTNTCCSHPREGEQLTCAVFRRTKQELGLDLDALCRAEDRLPEELGSFRYFEKYEIIAEHEIDHVFLLSIGTSDLALDPDPEEIAELQWIRMSELTKWMQESPEQFSAWFAPALRFVREKLNK